MQKTIDIYVTSHTEINKKWMRDLNVKHKPLKLLEEYKTKIYVMLGLVMSFQIQDQKHDPYRNNWQGRLQQNVKLQKALLLI